MTLEYSTGMCCAGSDWRDCILLSNVFLCQHTCRGHAVRLCEVQTRRRVSSRGLTGIHTKPNYRTSSASWPESELGNLTPSSNSYKRAKWRGYNVEERIRTHS